MSSTKNNNNNKILAAAAAAKSLQSCPNLCDPIAGVIIKNISNSCVVNVEKVTQSRIV